MVKRRGCSGRRGVAGTVVLACAMAGILAQITLATAANDPAVELKTATAHAGFSAKYEALKEVTMHLRHTLNCLVGPQDKLFDASAGNPCQGQGNGYLPDLKAAKGETAAYYDAWWAAQIAGQAVNAKTLGEAKAAARIVTILLDETAKAM
jgi:hypothetical protein